MNVLRVFFTTIINWFTPPDPDPRNRTLRYLCAGIFLAGLTGILLSFTIYKDASPKDIVLIVVSLFPNSEHLLKNATELTLYTGLGAFHDTVYHRLAAISWPLFQTSSALVGFWAGWQTWRGRLKRATYMLLIDQIVGLAMIILFAADAQEVVTTGAMLVLLESGFLLSKRAIWQAWIFMIGLVFTVVQLRSLISGEVSSSAMITSTFYGTTFLILSVEALILYGFRVEFDARANAWEKARLAELEQQRLRELDIQKNEFLYLMSHELRTPLHSIIGLSSCLLNGVAGDLDTELYTDIETIAQSGKHLLSLVNEVLDLAKIESGSVTLKQEPFAIDTVLSATLQMVKPQIEAKNLILDTNIPAQLPFAWADPRAIHQVMLNLLNNAIKFTQQGRIQVDVVAQAPCLIVSVKDTGIGIPLQYQNHIFDKFYQTARLYKKSEIGLGLAISKHLIELQNGRIWVESTPGEGSKFSFSLPITDSVKTYQEELDNAHLVH